MVDEINTPETRKSATLDIKSARVEDVDSVWKVIDSCSDYLETIGHSHWKNYYTKSLIEEKIKKQEVYLASSESQNVGTITLDTKPVEYYTEQEINAFIEPKAKAFYVTGLGVIPERQNSGVASQLMKFTEEESRKREIKYIRFDCRASYTDLVKFYEKRGYKRVGQFIDEEDNNEIYLLMEKELSS